MDEQTMQLLLGTAAGIATLVIAWLKQTMGKKGVSEEQADIVLDYVEDAFEEVLEAQPENAKLKAAFKHFRKLRRMWDDEKATTEDIEDYLDGLLG